MRFFVAIITALSLLIPTAVGAQVASSVGVPQPPTVQVPATLPDTGSAITAPATAEAASLPVQAPAQLPDEQKVEVPEKPKGEYIDWRRGLVSGVSENIITIVVPTKQRRSSYEPIMITPETKITRAGKPATLKEIHVRQYGGVRGYRDGDIVKADAYAIGGFSGAQPAQKKPAKAVAKKVTTKPKPKLAKPVLKKASPKPATKKSKR